MNIKDLRDGMSKVDVEGEITEISEPRVVNLRDGSQARVANCTIKDGTDSIKLTLWNEHIDMIKDGMKVKITNGYVSSFRGERQLNVGRYGKIEILEE
jgi:replication factor A1